MGIESQARVKELLLLHCKYLSVFERCESAVKMFQCVVYTGDCLFLG